MGFGPSGLLAILLEEVQEASRRYLAPAGLTAVVVGDAARVEPQLATLGQVVVTRDPAAGGAGE